MAACLRVALVTLLMSGFRVPYAVPFDVGHDLSSSMFLAASLYESKSRRLCLWLPKLCASNACDVLPSREDENAALDKNNYKDVFLIAVWSSLVPFSPRPEKKQHWLVKTVLYHTHVR